MVLFVMTGSRGGTGVPDPPGKLQVAICFLRNIGTDLPREGVQLHLEEGPYGPL